MNIRKNLETRLVPYMIDNTIEQVLPTVVKAHTILLKQLEDRIKEDMNRYVDYTSLFKAFIGMKVVNILTHVGEYKPNNPLDFSVFDKDRLSIDNLMNEIKKVARVKIKERKISKELKITYLPLPLRVVISDIVTHILKNTKEPQPMLFDSNIKALEQIEKNNKAHIEKDLGKYPSINNQFRAKAQDELIIKLRDWYKENNVEVE